MKMIARVTGMKRSKGITEKGQSYDSTKLFIEIQFPESQDMCGYASQEFAHGTYENYEKLLASGVKMPFKAEIDFVFVTNGKAVKQIVTNVVPVVEKPKNS
ncbi:hypothetical protein [Neisseria meningitidis]|uniref:hypothetical protein n=1 Tax=Neisseria meningitidis TaxID=487 RepID=UPI000BB64EB5|nr:hypothetical protein [Neisseria meningitidis]